MNKLIYCLLLLILVGCNNMVIETETANIVNRELENIKLNYEFCNKDLISVINYNEKDSLDNICAGYLSSIYWKLYEHYKDESLKKIAEEYLYILDEKTDLNIVSYKHPFLYNNYIKAYRSNNSMYYKDLLINESDNLLSMFNQQIGLLGILKKEYYQVNISNIMNLELLFWAGNETGNENYNQIANIHATNIIKEHFRPDYSCFKSVYYNSDGSVKNKLPYTNNLNDVTWALGQSYGLYGFVTCYRETGNSIFLQQAIRIADFIINNYIQINHGNTNETIYNLYNSDSNKDLASAIISSSLIELSLHVNNDYKVKYLEAVDIQLKSLNKNNIENTRKKQSQRNGYTYDMIYHQDINELMTDYYYLETLIKYKENYKL